MDTMTYQEAFDIFLKHLSKENLQEMRRVFLMRAMATARQIIGANDDTVMHASRGQISICFEVADRITTALTDTEHPAKMNPSEGIQYGASIT